MNWLAGYVLASYRLSLQPIQGGALKGMAPIIDVVTSNGSL